MNRPSVVLALVLAGAMLSAPSVQAQHKDGAPAGGDRRGMPPMPGIGDVGGGVGLLMLEQVQKELQLTDQQKWKLLAMAADPRANRGNLDKQLAAVLDPHQLKRLKQLRLQMGGAAALLDPEVARALKLNEQQRKKLKALNNQVGEKMREALLAAKGLPPDQQQAHAAEMREQMQQHAKEIMDQALEVLTPQQREKFEKIKGEQTDVDFSTLSPE